MGPKQPAAMTPDEVVQLRKQLNMTQSQFGALVKVSSVQVSRWENGVNVVTEPRALAIRNAVQDVMSTAAKL